jgi:hypothetical protein
MRVTMLFVLAVVAGCSRAPNGPAEPGSVVSLTVASADVHAGAARIVWRVRAGVRGTYLVQRRLDGAPWKGLAYLEVDPESHLVLEDGSVQPGARYAYRVRVAVEPEPVFAGEVAVEVPAQ